MNKILDPKQAITISEELRNQGEKIVLVGGCFDIVHLGHVRLFQEAKKRGDSLMVLLESDETVRRIKGKDRPIHSQKNRALFLEELKSIDYIVLLPKLTSDQEYDTMIIDIKPAIIATTKNDPAKIHKNRQAQLVGGICTEVIDRFLEHSTTRLAETLLKEETI